LVSITPESPFLTGDNSITADPTDSSSSTEEAVVDEDGVERLGMEDEDAGVLIALLGLLFGVAGIIFLNMAAIPFGAAGVEEEEVEVVEV